MITFRSGADFIPNDINLGGDQPATVLLTGPNMGGKSTTLRQAGLAVVLAQVGSYVFADGCTMTPVDRIFTRIGANDDIVGGESTFMVELSETSTILKSATKNSLIIMDELGRGTSTFDGYSIAYATLKYIAEKISCRVMFSTHYHKLTQDFKDDPRVLLTHMDCFVDEERKEVTFLYKMIPGVCPKSYGLNVAKMAGLKDTIVDRAEHVSSVFEETFLKKQEQVNKRTTVARLFQENSVENLLKIWNSMQKMETE